MVIAISRDRVTATSFKMLEDVSYLIRFKQSSFIYSHMSLSAYYLYVSGTVVDSKDKVGNNT